MDNKVKGKLGEALAKKHLESIGIKIIEENYRYKRGEIDLIGISSNQLLVFIEVKYWKKDIQFDIISILVSDETITHLEDAFN